MKAITAVCATGAAVPSIATGRIGRHHRDGENAEIQMYLSKLKDLVPYMPKNKKLSKLEVIENVIDYICDLQSALETTTAGGAASAMASFDASAVLSGALAASSGHRQPLGLRSSPNTTITTTTATSIQRRRISLNSNSSTGSNNSSIGADLNMNHTVSFVWKMLKLIKKKNALSNLICLLRYEKCSLVVFVLLLLLAL